MDASGKAVLWKLRNVSNKSSAKHHLNKQLTAHLLERANVFGVSHTFRRYDAQKAKHNTTKEMVCFVGKTKPLKCVCGENGQYAVHES